MSQWTQKNRGDLTRREWNKLKSKMDGQIKRKEGTQRDIKNTQIEV